jgi:hypothetical protein
MTTRLFLEMWRVQRTHLDTTGEREPCRTPRIGLRPDARLTGQAPNHIFGFKWSGPGSMLVAGDQAAQHGLKSDAPSMGVKSRRNRRLLAFHIRCVFSRSVCYYLCCCCCLLLPASLRQRQTLLPEFFLTSSTPDKEHERREIAARKDRNPELGQDPAPVTDAEWHSARQGQGPAGQGRNQHGHLVPCFAAKAVSWRPGVHPPHWPLGADGGTCVPPTPKPSTRMGSPWRIWKNRVGPGKPPVSLRTLWWVLQSVYCPTSAMHHLVSKADALFRSPQATVGSSTLVCMVRSRTTYIWRLMNCSSCC